VFHSSIWKVWKIVLWGPFGDGTGCQETYIFKPVLPNHAKSIKMRVTLFCCWNDFFYDCKC